MLIWKFQVMLKSGTLFFRNGVYYEDIYVHILILRYIHTQNQEKFRKESFQKIVLRYIFLSERLQDNNGFFYPVFEVQFFILFFHVFRHTIDVNFFEY